MKIKKEFVLRNVMSSWMVFPLGVSNTHLTDMISLNETAAMLWQRLEGGCSQEELVSAMLSEYDVSQKQARQDVEQFVATLRQNGWLEEEKEAAK